MAMVTTLKSRIQELEKENSDLRKEYSENTIIQSMNDMRDSYNSLDEAYSKLEKNLSNLETVVAQSVSIRTYNSMLERLDQEKKKKQTLGVVLNKLRDNIQEDAELSISSRHTYKVVLNFILGLVE